MFDKGASVRQEILAALEELDRSEQAFQAQMKEAETNFAAEMAKGRQDFAEGVAQARAEFRKALRDLGGSDSADLS